MKKNEKNKLIIWIVIALVIGFIIGLFITNITVGNAKLIATNNSSLISQTKATAEKNGRCCEKAGGDPCNVGDVCLYESIKINDYGDAESINVECTCIPNSESGSSNIPNPKGSSSNLGAKYPITEEVKQKAIMTELSDGSIRYDYIIDKFGEIITPQIKIDAESGCGCHTSSGCSCSDTCVSGQFWSNETDEGYETGYTVTTSVCRKNYSGTSGYTDSEVTKKTVK